MIVAVGLIGAAADAFSGTAQQSSLPVARSSASAVRCPSLLAGTLIGLFGPPTSVPAFAATVAGAAIAATTSRGIRTVRPLE